MKTFLNYKVCESSSACMKKKPNKLNNGMINNILIGIIFIKVCLEALKNRTT